jgi:AcrR family transcriptional regulator
MATSKHSVRCLAVNPSEIAGAPEEPVAGLLPEGIGPPAEIPGEIFDAALQIIIDCSRLDMRSLAAQLHIGRATLYRKVGSRDRLLGEVLWYLTRLEIAAAVTQVSGLEGADRVVALVEAFMRRVHGRPPLRRLLDAEPEIALRILTSKHGPVQRGTIAVVRRLLDREEARGALRLTIDADTLSYVIVRIGETFLYADAIAGHPVEIEQATEVVAGLLAGSAAPIGRSRRA